MEYFLIKPDGETTGTFSIEQIRAMVDSGFIGHDTRYWHEGITGWQPIDRIEESLQFEPPAPAPAKTVAPQKVAALLRAVPPPSTKLEKVEKKASSLLAIPSTPAVPGDVRPEARPYIPPAGQRDPYVPSMLAAARAEAASPAPARPTPDSRSKKAHMLERILLVFLGAFIVAAIDHGVAVVQMIGDALSTKITLSGDDTFVLLDPSTIKAFEQDLQNSPNVQTLELQIRQTADPVTLQRLRAGVQTETARHQDDVRQQYVRNNSAEYIEGATYRILNFYDDNGAPIDPSEGKATWVAINYKDHTVYAHREPGPAPAPQ